MSLASSTKAAPAERAQTGRPAARRKPVVSLLDTTAGRAGLQIAGVVLFFAAWQAAASVGWVSSFLVGAPAGIFQTFVSGLADGSLPFDTWITTYEAILGFVIGTVIGSAVGLGLWYSIFLARLTEPFIVALNSVPKIALAPIVILWFGTGLVSKVALAVSMTALVALIAAYQGAKDADPDLQALMRSMGASKRQIFFGVVVPSTVPVIISTFRINIGFGLVGAVVGEFMSSKRGLGHLIYEASGLYDLNTVWMGLFVLMALGFVLYHIIGIIEHRLLPWKLDSGRQQVQSFLCRASNHIRPWPPPWRSRSHRAAPARRRNTSSSARRSSRSSTCPSTSRWTKGSSPSKTSTSARRRPARRRPRSRP
jgi:NitT/TauT family transport system permease protein